MKIRWLHISDLHEGAPKQSWSWPDVETPLLADIQAVSERLGPIQLILFTGDLTFSGQRAQYARLTKFLRKLRKAATSHGHVPAIVAVPGNHDLLRPPTDVASLIRAWHEDEHFVDKFWESDNHPLRPLIDGAFEPYTRWWTDLTRSSRGIVRGVMPGDFSMIRKIGDARVGIIGLNTAALHMLEGDYKGRLALHQRQMLALCDDDVSAWCDKTDVRILLTHHPETWLTPGSYDTFRMSIAPPGRFAVHLCGHLHEPEAIAGSIAGAPTRRRLQAPSLFGQETYNGTVARLHGYHVAELDIHEWTLRVYPRLATAPGGRWRLVPDTANFELENESFTWKLDQPIARNRRKETPPRTPLSPAEPKRAAQPAQRKPVRIRLMMNTFLYLPVYIADRLGLFKQLVSGPYDIVVDRETSGSDEDLYDGLASIDRGGEDLWFGIGDPIQLYLHDRPRPEEIRVKVVAALITKLTFWAIDHATSVEHIPELARLFEEVVTYREGTTGHAVATMLKRARTDGNLLVRPVSAGKEFDELRRRKRDLLVLTPDLLGSFFIEYEQREELRISYSFSHDYPNQLVTALMVRSSVLKQHRSLVAEVIAALQAACALILAGHETAYAVAQEMFSDHPPGVVRSALQKAIDEDLYSLDLGVQTASWDNAIRMYHESRDEEYPGAAQIRRAFDRIVDRSVARDVFHSGVLKPLTDAIADARDTSLDRPSAMP